MTSGAVVSQEVVVERAGAIAIVRLNRPNRPNRLNALTESIRVGIIEAFDACDADDDVRAVVLTGTGRAFCAGADLEHGGDTFLPDQPGAVRRQPMRADRCPFVSTGRRSRSSPPSTDPRRVWVSP